MKKVLVIYFLYVLSMYAYTITDSYNRKIEIKSKPERIISLAPNMTEIIIDMGLKEKLKGRTSYSDFVKGAEDVEIVGDIFNPNLEKIISLNPDIIIASKPFPKDSMERVEKCGVPVVILFDERDTDGIYYLVKMMGEILDEKEKSTKLTMKIENEFREIKEIKEAINKKPAVYYMIGYGKYGDYTAGGDTYINDMIEKAGGINTARDLRGWKYSMEKLIEENPDIIIVPKNENVYENLLKEKNYSKLKAVVNGNVYEVDKNMIQIQGTGIIKGVQEIQEAIIKYINKEKK